MAPEQLLYPLGCHQGSRTECLHSITLLVRLASYARLMIVRS